MYGLITFNKVWKISAVFFLECTYYQSSLNRIYSKHKFSNSDFEEVGRIHKKN